MAYDEELATRIRNRVANEPGLTEQKMFGGLAFLINGNMAVAASKEGGLLLRVEPSRTEELWSEPQAEPFTMRGDKPMNGWLRVRPEGLVEDADLERWAEI